MPASCQKDIVLFVLWKFFRGIVIYMFRDEMDKCTHMLTAYISSLYDYCDFIDTQLDDFILEYGENVVESCLHQVMVLVSKYN